MSDIKNVRLICMDMDGTLFASNEQIPDVNIQALRECEKRGIRAALVSGRNYRFLADHALRISDRISIVSANGARIDESPYGPCIFEGVYDKEYACRVSRLLWENEVNYEAYTDKINYCFRPEMVTPAHRRSLEKYKANGHLLKVQYMQDWNTDNIEGIYKFVAFSDDPEMISALRSSFDALGIAHSSSSAQNVEIMPRGVDKGNALRTLAQHFGIPLKDTMAFGDYTNDIDMLMASGHPVAMENAVDQLKAVCRYTAPDHMIGGVGRFLYDTILSVTQNQ